MTNLILGSNSPRRKQILTDAGYKFSVAPIHANEDFPQELIPKNVPCFLSEKKSLAFPRELACNEILVTADTIVVIANKILNKPENYQEAFGMLRTLSGKAHLVFTGVTLRSNTGKNTFVDETKVFFKELSDSEIDFYITHFKPFDKAGAYGAQDWMGLVGIERLEGSFYNVMGLPIHLLHKELKKMNFSLP